MKRNNTAMFGIKRVFVWDDADGTPLVVRAERRGGQIRWSPVSVSAAGKANPEKEILVVGLRVTCGTSTWLKTPLADKHKARQILPSVLDTTLPFALDDCVYAFSDLWNGSHIGLPVMADEGTAALAVVVRNRDVVEQEQACSGAGLEAHLFDHEGIALWSSVAPAPSGTLRVMVWCRPRSMLVVLGLGAMYWSSHYLQGHDAAQIFRIIQLQKQTAAKGRYKDAVLDWYIGGDPAYVTRVQADLEGVPADQQQVLPDGPYHLARSLAQRALLPGAWRLPPLMGTAGKVRFAGVWQQRTRKSVVLLVTLTVLLAAAVLGRRHFWQRQVQQQDQALQRAVQAIVGYPVAARGRDAVLVAERELVERRRAMKGFTRERDISVFAGRMAAVTAESKGYLQHVSINSQAVEIKVWLSQSVSPGRYTQLFTDYGYGGATVQMLQEQDSMFLFVIRAERKEP